MNRSIRGPNVPARWGPIVLALLLSVAASPLHGQKATPAVAGLATVRTVSRASLPRGERITVEFNEEVVYAGDRVANPDRMYLDFKNSIPASGVAASVQALTAGPVISGVRIARHTEKTTRIVLQLNGNPRYSVFPVYNPFRIVIDVESDGPPAPTPAPSSAATAPPAPAPAPVQPPPAAVSAPEAPLEIIKPRPPDVAFPLPTPAPDDVTPADEPPPLQASQGGVSVLRDQARSVTLNAPAATTKHGDYSLARQLGLGVSRIVIDAGHGGHDPGAQSNGVSESELVLDVALRLRQLLQAQPGVEVVLTRSTDEFIPLEERTAIANREGADLFLSIHANASKQSSARGVETYFLNFATNPAAEAVAARENSTSGKTMGNLPDLVKTIALNNKVVESRELATMVQTSMMRRLRSQNQALRDLGVKQAPFVVLIGAAMPSVLAEISFVTNKPEASLLKQGSYRQRIAQALCDAVLKYQASLKKVTTIAEKTERQ
jgi:N-acetylmuramoyl-L-alanine amidase